MPATPVARQRSPSTPPPAEFPRKNSPNATPQASFARKNSPSAGLPAAPPRKNSPGTPENSVFQPFWACRANFFALTPTIRPSRANFFAHRTQPRTNFETNDASAATDMGQRETTITTARPSTATIETGITSAPKKRSKNAHSSPAKAMAVSTPHTYERAKATPVSGERVAWSTGPRCNTRGRRWGLAGRPVCGRRYKRRQTNTI